MLHGVNLAVARGFWGEHRVVHAELGVRGRCCVSRRGNGGSGCHEMGFAFPVGRDFRVLGKSISSRNGSCPSSSSAPLPIPVRCQGGRRHHRRRGLPEDSGRKQRGDEKVEITLDFAELKQRAADGAASTKKALVSSVGNVRQSGVTFIKEGKQAWNELRTSVAVRNDKRVVIAVKQSTIDFAGRTVLWTVLTIVFARVFLSWARRFQWGWADSFNRPRTVRDRSLGGREVVVKNGLKLWEGGPFKWSARNSVQGTSPLDYVKTDARSEKELNRLRAVSDPFTSKKSRSETRLPAWWPSAEQAPKLSLDTTAQAQREANALLNDMLERRMNGVDFESHNIIRLRELCRNYGVEVKFETTSTRDAFYRTALQLVHNVCTRSVEFPNEGVVNFTAGLARNIGIDVKKAVIMVIASVAAQTRATFLQTWALHERGEIESAHKELQGLIRIHEKFSPNRNSPEMDMVARGLTYLPLEDRRELLQMYIFAGGNKTEWLAKEALGLTDQN